jgi:hypothetical protein
MSDYSDLIPVRTVKLDFQDSKNPLLRIQYVDSSKDASDPNPYCKIVADANGSGGTKLILAIDIGASASSYKQYQFSAYATAQTEITNSGGTASSITHTQCTTLGALVKAINDLGIGLYAGRLNAPTDYSLNSDDFLDVTSYRQGPLASDILYKDTSEILTGAVRVGIPENCNNKPGRGKLALVRVVGLANSNSATDCVLKISRDPDEYDATKEVELSYTRYIPDNSITELYDFSNMPPVESGPILVEITSTVSLAEGAWVIVAYKNVEV